MQDRDPADGAEAPRLGSETSSAANSVAADGDLLSDPDSDGELTEEYREDPPRDPRRDIATSSNLLALIRHIWGKGGL